MRNFVLFTILMCVSAAAQIAKTEDLSSDTSPASSATP